MSVQIPDSIQMLLFPYCDLIMTQYASNPSFDKELGIIVEAKKDCKYSDLKVSILNHSLRIRSLPKLTKFEYSKLLNDIRVWAFDSKFGRWIPLRSQADWDRVRILKMMETDSSTELQKLMYDDGTFVLNAKEIPNFNEINDSIESSVIQIRRKNEPDSENESLMSDLQDDTPPQLHILSNSNQTKSSQSPIKQNNMAKILEQRLLLSRL